MKKLSYFITAALVAVSFGCGSSTAVNSGNANTPKMANTNTAAATPAANTNTAPADEAKGGSLATPTEAYKTAYEYRKNGDVAGLKRVMSKDILEFMTEMAKMENKTLEDLLTEMSKDPQADKPETRNEKITGETATIEYREKDGSWKTLDYVREGSEWKMTIGKDPDAEKKK